MRDINLIVVHCSATRVNQNFTVEQLEACHKARGFDTIGYHYYITKDGRMILSSEVGVLECEPDNILVKDRLRPGKMLLVDTVKGEVVDDEKLKEFYASRGFENQPQRCKPCRDARKNSTRGERQMFDAVCASCGKTCKVPFQPREDRPVYCSDCFARMKQN